MEETAMKAGIEASFNYFNDLLNKKNNTYLILFLSIVCTISIMINIYYYFKNQCKVIYIETND